MSPNPCVTQSMGSLGSLARARFRNGSLGFVFQAFNLIDSLTAQENVEVPLGYAGMGAKHRREIAEQALNSVGLGHKRGSFPRHLSGGEQQRVSIARAIANAPALILADEPTGNLDGKNSTDIMNLLSGLNEKGRTIVMVTHDTGLAAFGRVRISMSDGRIVSVQR